jgi:CHAT domain
MNPPQVLDPAILQVRLTGSGAIHSVLKWNEEVEEGQSPAPLPSDVFDFADQYYESLSKLLAESEPPNEVVREYEQHQADVRTRVIDLALPDRVRTRLEKLCRQADLVLQVQSFPFKLDRLPWELIGDLRPRGQDLSGPGLVVFRSVPLIRSRAQAWPDRRLLILSSSPLRGRSPNAIEELEAIRDHLNSHDRVDVTYKQLHNARVSQFWSELDKFKASMMHMALHGDTGGLYFQLDKDKDSLRYDSLVGELHQRRNLSTVVATVCHSACTEERQASFARRLVEKGVPAAIGMACDITPAASLEFTSALYERLCEGGQITDAYAAGVRAIRGMAEFDRLLWSVPVLYTTQKVIPFPTSEQRELLDRLNEAVQDIDALRSELQALPVQPGLSVHEWNAVSTGVHMASKRAGNSLRYLIELASHGGVGPHWWQTRLGDTSRRARGLLEGAETSLWRLCNDGVPKDAWFPEAENLRKHTPQLESELQRIHELVASHFPMVPRER